MIRRRLDSGLHAWSDTEACRQCGVDQLDSFIESTKKEPAVPQGNSRLNPIKHIESLKIVQQTFLAKTMSDTPVRHDDHRLR